MIFLVFFFLTFLAALLGEDVPILSASFTMKTELYLGSLKFGPANYFVDSENSRQRIDTACKLNDPTNLCSDLSLFADSQFVGKFDPAMQSCVTACHSAKPCACGSCGAYGSPLFINSCSGEALDIFAFLYRAKEVPPIAGCPPPLHSFSTPGSLPQTLCAKKVADGEWLPVRIVAHTIEGFVFNFSITEFTPKAPDAAVFAVPAFCDCSKNPNATSAAAAFPEAGRVTSFLGVKVFF